MIIGLDLIPREKLIEKIMEHGGVIQRVCKDLNCSRSAWENRFRYDPEIQAEIAKARYAKDESRLDVAEAVLDRLMSNAERDPVHAFKSSTFILQNKGQLRGYSKINPMETKETSMGCKIDDLHSKITQDYDAIKNEALS